MIQVFKMLKGFDDIDRDSFFKVSSTGLRGHSLKLFKNSFQTNTGRFSFSNRIVSDWNTYRSTLFQVTQSSALKIVWIDIIRNVGGSNKSNGFLPPVTISYHY